MRIAVVKQACSAIAAAGLAAAGALTGSAEASIISNSPSLPLLGVPYIATTGVGCFDAAMVCVAPGQFTLASTVSSVFVPAEGMLPAVQDIVADATFDATLTTLGGTLIGPISLTGTVDKSVEGAPPIRRPVAGLLCSPGCP